MSINNPQNSNNSQNTTSNIVQNIVNGVVNNLTSDNVNNAANLYAIANGYKNGDYVNSSLGFGGMAMNLLNTPLSNTVGTGIPIVGDIVNKDWKGLGLDSARILADKILYNKLYATTTNPIPATLSNSSNTALNSAANTAGITGSGLGAVGVAGAGLVGSLPLSIPAIEGAKLASLAGGVATNVGTLQGGVAINAIGTTAGTTFLQGLAGATLPTAIPALFAGLGLSIANMIKKKQWEKDLNRYNQRLSDFEQYNEKYSEVPQLSNLNNDLLNEYIKETLIDRSAADSLINVVDNSRNMLPELQKDTQIQQTLANINDTIQDARMNIQDNNINELVLSPYDYSNKTIQELNIYKSAIEKNIIELDNSLEPYANLAGNGLGKEMYRQAIKEIDSIIADKAYKGGINYGKYTVENTGHSIYDKALSTKLSQEKVSLSTNIDFWENRVNTLKQELEYNNSSNPLINLISQFKNKDKVENLRIAEETLSNFKLQAQNIDKQIASLSGSVETTVSNNDSSDQTSSNTDTGGQNTTTNNQNQPDVSTDTTTNNQNGSIDNTPNDSYEEYDNYSNSNTTLQGRVSENNLSLGRNDDSTSSFPWHFYNKELDNAVFDSVIKTVTDNWNQRQSTRKNNNNFNRTEYMNNNRKWAPAKSSVWHEDNFKDASIVEQVIYADSIHLMNMPENDLTPDDRYHFEQNIRLLSILKSLRDGTMKQHVTEELERQRLVEEIRKVAASKGLNMPSLSGMGNQQIPYSRIPRGLNVSRGEGREQKANLYTERELKIRREYESDVRSLGDNLIDRTKPFITKLQNDSNQFLTYYKGQDTSKQQLLMFDYIYSPLVRPNNLINDTIMADKIVKPEYYKFAEFGYRLAEYELTVNSNHYEYNEANGYGKVKGNPLDGQDLVDAIKQTANKKFKSVFKRNLSSYEMDSVISGWSLKKTEKDIQTPWEIKRGIRNIINYEFEYYRLPKITEKLLTKYMPTYNDIESIDLREKIKIKVSKYLDENYLKVNISKIDQFGLPNRVIRISSPYGYRKIKYGSKYHRGIDIGGESHNEIINLPIPSQFDGHVIASGRMGAAGETVIIQTEDLFSNKYLALYMHMNKRNVLKGDVVKKGSIIGTLGGTGKTDNCYDPHLHFEIRDINNNSVDYGQKGMDMLNLLTLNYLEKKFKNDNVRIIDNIKKYLQKEKIVITPKK